MFENMIKKTKLFLILVLFCNCQSDEIVTNNENQSFVQVEFIENNKIETDKISQLHELVVLKKDEINIQINKSSSFTTAKVQIVLKEFKSKIKVIYNDGNRKSERIISKSELIDATNNFVNSLCNLEESYTLTTLSQKIEVLNNERVVFSLFTRHEFDGINNFVYELIEE